LVQSSHHKTHHSLKKAVAMYFHHKTHHWLIISLNDRLSFSQNSQSFTSLLKPKMSSRKIFKCVSYLLSFSRLILNFILCIYLIPTPLGSKPGFALVASCRCRHACTIRHIEVKHKITGKQIAIRARCINNWENTFNVCKDAIIGNLQLHIYYNTIGRLGQ